MIKGENLWEGGGGNAYLSTAIFPFLPSLESSNFLVPR